MRPSARKFSVIPLRQNRGEKCVLVGTVNARAVLFQGLARYIFNNWAIWNNGWFHLHLRKRKPLLCHGSYSLFYLLEHREHLRRLKTKPAVHRLPHDINDIYYDKKSSLVSITWAGLITQAFPLKVFTDHESQRLKILHERWFMSSDIRFFLISDKHGSDSKQHCQDIFL